MYIFTISGLYLRVGYYDHLNGIDPLIYIYEYI